MTSLSILYLVSVIVFTGSSQVLLKMGANRANKKKFIVAYANPYTFTAYSLYMLTTILTVYALKNIPLNLFYASTSLKFVLILILSRLMLREKINSRKVFAVLLIVAGVIVFNM
ncbi:EamA family transporter [Methanosarcina sp.]|jgi:multidrug transporter EmrE-like cation transporter|uniref:EamA family transporter n=1 Tax=Methanosarcina sp. TaxID=2213 RepID=UPI002D08600E|nr:EamA family transporter [Methanosarcina sp.]HOW14885.1 EamA family transporter [Methanosarcina sp.]